MGKGPLQKMNSCFPFLDGVVLVDPDYLKDRKGTRPKSRSWRGGRKKKTLDGLAFGRMSQRDGRLKQEQTVGFRGVCHTEEGCG